MRIKAWLYTVLMCIFLLSCSSNTTDKSRITNYSDTENSKTSDQEESRGLLGRIISKSKTSDQEEDQGLFENITDNSET